jgi:uncharacterized phiE125 gp8 family phage protein
MRIQQATYPSGTLITLAEAKLHLRVTVDNEDSVINDCIKSATSLVETYTNQYLQSRTFVAYLDIQEFTAFNEICIWKYPITSIESIKYLDSDGTEQTFSSANYTTDLIDCPARILPTTIATVKLNIVNQYRVYFTAGHLTREAIDSELIGWVKIFTAFFYQTRQPEYTGQAVSEIAYKYQTALDKFSKAPL